MTLAQKLRAEGRQEGKLQLLLQLTHPPPIPPHELEQLSLDELERRFHDLERESEGRFKS